MLRSDTRGRIPFAVLGALLLITSTIYASTAGPAPVTRPVTEQVIDQAQLEARMALSTALRNAGRRAAAQPVIEPASSGVGSLLSETATFRDYLRLLIVVEARDTLAAANASRDSVSVAVSPPPIEDRADLEAAMSAVTLRRVVEGRYRVTFEDLEVALRRHGRPVESFSYDAILTTAVPALEVHDRTGRFQERLQADLGHPGLTQDLTTRVFAVTWARGYAQYGGAPIENVLANRHVAVMANDALLAQQAAVFGQADRDSRRLTRRAAIDVAMRDGLRGAEHALTSHIESARDRNTDGHDEEVEPTVSLPSAFDQEHSYDVDATADETFLAFVEGDVHPGLEMVLEDAYRATVRAETRSRLSGSKSTESGVAPANSTHVYTTTRTDRRLADGEWRESSVGRTLRSFSGSVVIERVRTDYWLANNSFQTTTTTRRRTYEVSTSLVCEGTPGGPSLNGRSGCGLGETARNRLTAGAMNELVRDGGGTEGLALASVSGRGTVRSATIDIHPPETVRERAYHRVASLRQDVKDVSVSTETRSIASSANPATMLADELSARRSHLVDEGGRGDAVAERAIATAQQTYLDQLESGLRSRSSVVDQAQGVLADRLQDRAIPISPPDSSGERRADLDWEVATEPAYLSIEPRASQPAPMATRNVNIFTVPYGDAADSVAGALDRGDSGSVSLGTAAKTLRALERSESVDPSLERRLGNAIEDSLGHAAAVYRPRLGSAIGPRAADRAVRGGFEDFDSPTDRALAIADGRMAAAIASHLPSDRSVRERDRLEVRLRETTRELRDRSGVRIDESIVDAAASEATAGQPLREVAKAAGETAGRKTWKEATSRTPGHLPAGVPLVPVPGYWYATANAWSVSVRGSYERVTVRAPRGSPGRSSNGTIEYIRADEPVEIDLFGDEGPERLGRNRAIQFTADTGALVVVPPGGTGVGDVDGNADERSPGWDGRTTRQ